MYISQEAAARLRDSGWFIHLQDAIMSKSFCELKHTLAVTKSLLPARQDVFKALIETPLDTVKVVIIGDEPYSTPGTSNGLAFGSNRNYPPPELLNIIKGLEFDVGIKVPRGKASLLGWAHQGVLLLNSVLTTEPFNPGIHENIGWEELTAEVIKILLKRNNIVYILWGKKSQRYKDVMCDVQPYRGGIVLSSGDASLTHKTSFLGHNHFSRTNEYLVANKKSPIDWSNLNDDGGASPLDDIKEILNENKHTRIHGVADVNQY